MSSVQQQLSKGFYQYSQIDRFVSVKNYIFARVNDRKCLLLRFSNDSDFSVNAMEMTITQLDSNGAVIGKIPVSFSGLSIEPGDTYTPRQGIVVDDLCHQFKLQFSCVTSGSYTYRVRDGRITVLYPKSEEPPLPILPQSQEEQGFSVTPRKRGKPGLAVLLAVLALLSIIGLNIHHMYQKYTEGTKNPSYIPPYVESIPGNGNFTPDYDDYV